MAKSVFRPTEIKNSEENSNRKYRTKIVLTDEGKQINNNLNEAIAIAVNKASKNLDEVDRENFYRVFFYITNNLDEICGSYLKEK